MLINAILVHEVPVVDEKIVKLSHGEFRMIPPPRFWARSSRAISGY